MLTIPVRVCGDSWGNPTEVQQLLEQAAGKDTVVLDLHAEGPSLHTLTITQTINKYCVKYSVDPKKIYITNWPNRAETVDYTLVDKHHVSHFFSRSKEYWPVTISPKNSQYAIGFFVGRKTVPRAVLAHYLHTTYGSKCLLSCMLSRTPLPWDNTNAGIEIDTLDQWLTDQEQSLFRQWWANNPIASIDGYYVHDQYNPAFNTNSALLNFYNKFDIELVAESYTRGDTFFVTEKTVRPLAAAKPVLVYGPKRFLERLRGLGYETYGSLWDESYDYLEGPERWTALKSTVDFVMNLPGEEKQILLLKAKDIASRNREHLAKTIGITL
jgi:hypothetical protein